MATQDVRGLEDHLRNMILSNVSVSGHGPGIQHAPHQQPPNGRGRGRGRGHGGTFRGRGGRHTDGQPHLPTRNTTHNPGGRGGRGGMGAVTNPPQPPRILRQPVPALPSSPPVNPAVQEKYLDQIAAHEIPNVEISPSEVDRNLAFNSELEAIFQKAFAENYAGEDIAEIKLVSFGSLASGFATPDSDMDLAVVVSWKDPAKISRIDKEIPRLLEKAVLDAKMGGRLLTKTRVPILKVCQLPTEALATALLEERQKWDDLSEENKWLQSTALQEMAPRVQPVLSPSEFPSLAASKEEIKKLYRTSLSPKPKGNEEVKSPTTPTTPTTSSSAVSDSKDAASQPPKDKIFRREKKLGPLDFPKSGVGIQCDINFENPLGIHNTRLLRCYSHCDPRVRPMVLFVKSWAKRRKINSAYSGTLSSYGWVLMVLHYLVNIAQPAVCPNLQMMWQPPKNMDVKTLEKLFRDTKILGYPVRFFDDEAEITKMARAGRFTANTQSVGALLKGFFQYYSSVPQPYTSGQRPPSFYWTSEVLSLRTPNGVRSKYEKGWTGAKTTISANGREVRHRYLFCIEDPFELDHNVARTVTHPGIVAIRDEFRRAWRILTAVGQDMEPEGGLFDEIVEQGPPTPVKEEVVDGASFNVVDVRIGGFKTTPVG
ncbi:PAP/OAS1 substrate-binding domain-containing protein [Massarina eburnea CBS 473.64]|uniref:polynucleotide adenylyltransferase n=1 Tax=Massarina eburnea CBS 473.64 TaxID=1395130 RepID=A0A6A6SCI3_9PLEO|nr:PAP/OAS1 substrate-binding domain-containing protein [Massarina eburnea CBS 473.64]